jgi:ABC-type transporter Mla MlaB component
MLRITTIHENQHATLKLEGKLLEPWLDELRNACARAKDASGRVCLDLANLTFADAAGLRFLRDLFQQDVSASACSPFVAELLREQ